MRLMHLFVSTSFYANVMQNIVLNLCSLFSVWQNQSNVNKKGSEQKYIITRFIIPITF